MFESLESHKESFVFQITAFNKALGSGAYMDGHACRVVYDKDMTDESSFQFQEGEDRPDLGCVVRC